MFEIPEIVIELLIKVKSANGSSPVGETETLIAAPTKRKVIVKMKKYKLETFPAVPVFLLKAISVWRVAAHLCH